VNCSKKKEIGCPADLEALCRPTLCTGAPYGPGGQAGRSGRGPAGWLRAVHKEEWRRGKCLDGSGRGMRKISFPKFHRLITRVGPGKFSTLPPIY
jgi:hypothetical protein